jgi:uncharacterized protein
VDIAIALTDASWNAISPQVRRLRRFILMTTLLPLGLVATAATLWIRSWAATVAVAVAVVAVLIWGWVLIGRNAASWRYAERADDLLIGHGVLFRTLVVVPYGRMQFVDVQAGPLERWFGIATVQLHTAAASTDARIPGLAPREAARLRDRLAQLGEARLAGL